jgi:hypothetical protein
MAHYHDDKAEEGEKVLDNGEFVPPITDGCDGCQVHPHQERVRLDSFFELAFLAGLLLRTIRTSRNTCISIQLQLQKTKTAP